MIKPLNTNFSKFCLSTLKRKRQTYLSSLPSIYVWFWDNAFIALKEKSTHKNNVCVYVVMLVMCVPLRVIMCQLVLYVHFSCENLAVLRRSDVTEG